jgi:hypothetical protein
VLRTHIITCLDTLNVQALTTITAVDTVERCEINDPDPAPAFADALR